MPIDYKPLNRKVSGIYVIMNTENQKCYIGSAVCIKKRLSEHVSRLRSGDHHNKILLNAWAKCGEDKFEYFIAEVVMDIKKLVEIEQAWIDIYHIAEGNYGYNILKVAYSGIREAKNCCNCGLSHKPLRKGRCKNCNEYLRKTGNERPYIENGKYEKELENLKKNCIRCERPNGVKGYAGKGYCKSCYRVIFRKDKNKRLGVQDMFGNTPQTQ